MSILNPLNLIPPQYKVVAIVIAAVLIVGFLTGGGFKAGHTFAKNHYVAIISKMEKDEAQLQADKADLQTKLTFEISNIKEKIVTKYVDRVKVIREKEYVYVEQAKNDVPSQFELSNGWVYLHDQAARNSDASSARSSDATSSGIKDNQAIGTITENYASCHKNIEQLTALQEYLIEARRVVEEANESIRKLKGKK